MLLVQELSSDIYHKVYSVLCLFFFLMIIRATVVCAHRPNSLHSDPKYLANPGKNSTSGHHNPTGEAEESREEKDPIKST